jgi:hypothetical protein
MAYKGIFWGFYILRLKMKIIDKTLNLAKFIASKIENGEICLHFPDSSQGDYYLLSSGYVEKEFKFLFFKSINRKCANKIIEVIMPDKVRIPKNKWSEYFSIVRKIIEEYEILSGRTVTICKVNDFE